ncbi:HNH endonuclease [Microbacterium phage Footloose]|uniref:HNH endonuclease n=1 Tax=Microbacterium phage Footloose TaxID=2836048 RepID=A0A8F3E9Q2_9CAUD|nr:HNH endonuclease [Microbacterium phage Footloose]QWY84598.1 HNH endonuclease [Microbacterium phage Footloose]
MLARALCSTHYSRWRRAGGQVRPKAWISDTERRCSKCEVVKHPAEFYSAKGGWCSSCQRDHGRRKYTKVLVPLPACYCVECGERYSPRRRTDIICSRACAETRRRRFQRIESPVYRALRAEATVEVVDPAIVFERDDWICQLCHEDIPRSAVWPDPLSATMDHIKPLSRGGEHSYANCQASHFTCNASKGAKYEEADA